MRTVVVCRHDTTLEVLRKHGLVPDDAVVLRYIASPGQIQGAHVIGKLPPRLAVHADRVTTYELRIPQHLRGTELGVSEVNEYLTGLFTYRAERTEAA